MKKLLLALVLLAVFAAMPLFAWEPEDLTKFPNGQKGGDVIINLGIGLPVIWNDLALPPMRFSLDVNVPMGDQGLPFFIGGSTGLSGYKYASKSYFWLPLGVRFGYHFNWDVDNLDTYAVTTAGWTLYLGDGRPNSVGSFYYDIKVGARYFITDWFGFWAEAGFGATLADIGFAFKF